MMHVLRPLATDLLLFTVITTLIKIVLLAKFTQYTTWQTRDIPYCAILTISK